MAMNEGPKKVLSESSPLPVLKRMKLSEYKKTMFVSLPLDNYLQIAECKQENDPDLEIWNGKNDECLAIFHVVICLFCRMHGSGYA